MLSIVHLSHNDIIGGASRAAYRIHRCIEDNKNDYLINSSMRVVKKYSSDPTVTCLNNNSFIWKRLQPRISRLLKSNLKTLNYSPHNIAYPNTGLLKEINNIKSLKKIIHLHWLGDNTISIEEVGKLNGPIFGLSMINGLFVGLSTIRIHLLIKMAYELMILDTEKIIHQKVEILMKRDLILTNGLGRERKNHGKLLLI